MRLRGRQVIYSDVSEINSSNIVDVIHTSISNHSFVRMEVDYLLNYYNGNQPILNRTKKVRPSICNKIVENRASEIVSFKVGSLCSSPIQYVSRNNLVGKIKEIDILNSYMLLESKMSKDEETIFWSMVCGTAYRLVLPSEGECPFKIFNLDPRYSFVIYSNDLANTPLAGVSYRFVNDKRKVYVYTKDCYYELYGDVIKFSSPHSLGVVPIIEYPANLTRIGCFEKAIDLLDALNLITSNRLDGVEQFIQSFLKFINCDIDPTTYDEFIEKGAIKVNGIDGRPADIGLISSQLDQSQTQILKNDLYSAILSICGVPSRGGGQSTSDTGAAVILREGWELAETQAKSSELVFKKSERQMLSLILKIMNGLVGTSLDTLDIDIKFTRRNYEAIQSKTQILVSLLATEKVAPLLAFQTSGLFADPDSACMMSEEYIKKLKEEREVEVKRILEQES